jgi:hypothetical protein
MIKIPAYIIAELLKKDREGRAFYVEQRAAGQHEFDYRIAELDRSIAWNERDLAKGDES